MVAPCNVELFFVKIPCFDLFIRDKVSRTLILNLMKLNVFVVLSLLRTKCFRTRISLPTLQFTEYNVNFKKNIYVQIYLYVCHSHLTMGPPDMRSPDLNTHDLISIV